MTEKQSALYWTVSLFLFLLVLTAALKFHALFSPALFLDDNRIFYESLYEDVTGDSLYIYIYTAINTLFKDPASVKIFYLLAYAGCGALSFVLLKHVFKNNLTTALIVSMAYITPSSAIMIVFINGSYNILFLLLFLIGVCNLFQVLDREFPSAKMYLLFGLGTLSIGLSVQFTTNGVLVPLALLLLPWWRSKLMIFHRNIVNRMVILFIIVIVGSMVINIVESGEHQYNKIPDRLTFEPVAMLSHGFILVSNLIRSYWHPQMSTGQLYASTASIEGHIVAAVIAVFLLGATVVYLFSSHFRNWLEQDKERRVFKAVAPFFLFSLVLSVGPLTPIKVIHLWHYFLPGLLAVILFSLLIRKLLGRIIFDILAAVVVIASSFSVYSQVAIYSESARERVGLAAELADISAEWQLGSEIWIVTEKGRYLSGFGADSGYRDLNFVRLNTLRHDLSGVRIGSKDKLSDRMMYGLLDPEVTVYIYAYDGAILRPIESIILEQGAELELRTLANREVKRKSFPTSHIAELYKELDAQKKEAIFLADQDSMAGIDPPPSFINFDEQMPIEVRFDLPAQSEGFSIELTLLGGSGDCSDNSSSCPPMPLLVFPLAIYELSPGRFQFQVRHKAGDRYLHHEFELKRWQKVLFVFDIRSQRVFVLINNKLKSILEGVEIDLSSMGKALIGQGYLDRRWRGKVGYVRVTDSLTPAQVPLIFIDGSGEYGADSE